jgi:hypothetical protein
MGAFGLPSDLPGSASEEAARQGTSAASAKTKNFMFPFYFRAPPKGHSELPVSAISLRFVF